MQKLYKKYSVKGFIQGVKFFAVLFFTTLLSVTVKANVYVPTTFTDPAFTAINNATGVITAGAGIGLISLRSALTAADNLGGTHTITLSTGTYNLTLAIPNRQITIGNTNQNITINGNGPTNTIISNTLDANKDRILFINPTGATNSPVITVNGIRFQNAFLSSDPYGGAAICAGGGSAESLTVTNCTFDNNVLPANAYGGAAICMQVRGNLTVDNCTFTSNVSNDADGGAILFIIFGSGLGTGYGTLSVTNSSFTSNSVVFPGAGTSNGGALAFTGQAGSTPFNATINNNTFVTNTADGLGGAISANNSPNVSTPQIHFNRFFNNTSAASALSSGLHFVESSGSVNAENNWWGCNTNPVSVSSTAPCNQAGGDVAGGGSLDANPWLQLKTTASPNPICNTPAGLGNTTTVTTSFLNNSDGTAIPVANLTRLIGLPVTWGPTTLGSLSAQQLSIQAAGTATATFTSNGTGGTATVNSQVDNVPAGETTPARASITVNTLPTVTNPANFTSCVGGVATFTSTITGTPAPAIQWRIGAVNLVNGVQGSGSTVSGATTNTLTITNVQVGDASANYNVQASNQCGLATSANATLFVNSVTGGTVGSDQTICSGGDPALFTESVASTGSGALTYQWQSSTTSCAAGFSNIGGATSTTYDAPSGLAVTTFYRRVTTSTLNAVPCTANSNCITVTVNNVTGGTVAADQTICSGGDPAAFTQTVASTGSGALTYQWQSSTTSCAAGFSDIGGATSTTYDAPSGLAITTFYRRVTTSTLTAVPCTANSNCVTVFVNDVTGGTVGSDQTICSPFDPAAFTQSVASTGSGALTYQWQSSTTDCVSGFSNIGGATATTYDPPSGLAVTTYYRRVTTSTLNAIPCTANSNCITVTRNNVTGGTVGSDQTICSGGDPAAFTETVASTGTGPLTYQWQSSTTSCAAGFSNIGGATSTTYDAPAGLAVTTFYRRVTTSTVNAVPCTANSNCITVTVNSVTGGTIGSNQSLCSPADPAIIVQLVASTGSGALTYQWQSSTTDCVSGFSNIGGATAISYDPPAGLTQTTFYRRVTTSTLAGVPCTANSNCVTETVNPNNTITLTSAPGTDNQSVLINTPIVNITYATTGATGATVTGLPAGVNGVWAANVVTISGSPTTAVGSPFNYTVTLTGGCGIITANGTITVTVCSITLTSAAGTNAQSVCINTPIINITYSTTGATGATFAGLPAGVTGAWAANVVTISGSPTAAGIFNYTVTPTGGGCSGAVTATGTISVGVIPDAVATPSSQTVCSAVPITTIVLTGTVPGTVFNWTRDNNVTVTGIAASGAGDISGTLTNTTAAPITVTFTITPVNNGCPGTAITATVLVNPTPNAVATPSAQTICSGSAITTIVLSGAVSGTVFNWVRDNTVAVTGIAASGAGDISGSLTNTTNAPVTVTFTITPTANGCPGAAITATVVVNPIPDAVATPSSQTRCSGVAITTIVLTGNIAGTVFNWTRDNTIAVTGIAASGSGNIAGILTNTTAAPVTVTFTITPTANGCPGTPITATVLVNPNPAAFVIGGGGVTVCPTGTTLSGPIDPNYTYQWGRSLFVAPFTNMGTAQTQAVTTSAFYQLVVTNQYGCSASNTTVVNVADYVFNGSLGAGDPQQTGRLNRFAVISTCAAPKACPGLFTAVGARFYDSYTVANIRNVPVCATIGVNSGCSFNIFSVAYSNSFNPANLCANYLGDPGSSPTTSIFYEVTIPALSTIVVVVHEVNVGVGCASYQLTVDVPRDPAAITVSPSATVCSGTPVTLTASAANSYSWTPGGAITQSILVNPPVGPNNYSVLLGYGNNGCNDNAATVVTVSPTPDVNAVTNQYFCGGTSTPVISLTGSVPGTTFNWTNTNTAIGLGASGSGDIPSFIATNATAAPISGTITVTPVNGSCTGTPITFTITIASTPSITSVTDDDICEPGGVVNLAAAGNGTINWWNALTGGVVINTGTTFNPNVTTTTTYYVDATTTSGPQSLLAMPAQSNTFPGNVRGYWFTAPTNFVITSLSVPTTASSGPMSIAVMKFTGNIPPPVFSATTNAFTTVFQTGNNPSLGSVPCNIPVAAGEVIGILGYRGNINSYAPGDYNTTIAGFPVQLQRLGMQFPLSTSPPHDIWREFGALTSISRVEFEYSVGQNCVSAPRVPVTATVFTLPAPTATPSSQTICSGPITTIVLASQVPGTTFAWTRDNTVTVTGIAANGTGDISGSLTNTTSAPITVTFTITATSPDGCVAPQITATVLVNPTPNAIATPASQTVCSGTPITTIVLSGAVAGTVFNWTRDNNVPVTGIAASGAGDISGTLTNTTTSNVTVTFTITPTANGCTGPSITATVLVKPTPTAVALPPSQTICSGNIAAISFTGNLGPAANYDWVRDNNATVTGLGASGSGNINAALTNTTIAPVTVTFTITPTFNGCAGTPITATVLVNPTPNAVATPASQTICSASSITTIVLSGVVAGTTFNWTRDNSVTVTGIAASGSGNISGSLTNTTNAPVTVTFTITPTANGCPGTPITATVLVNPTPNAVATPASQTVCSANPITTIVLSGAVAGTTFNWTRDNTVAVTGIGASGSGNISGTLTNTTNAPVTVTFTITPTANGCPGAPITATVLVNPTPNAVATPASQTICSAGSVTTIVLTGAVAGTTFNWTRDNTITVTGGIANSGSGNISGTLTNTTNAPITVTFTITPTANGCPGPSITATVLVNPTPNAVATPASQTICSANPITTIVLSGAVAGTTFNWTRDNTVAVTGIGASGSGNISGTLTNTTTAPVTVTFTITPTANGCPGPSITATVLVNPTPNAVATPASQTICSNNLITTIVLSGAVSGTTYNWTRNNTGTVTGIAASGSGNISGSLTNTTTAPITVTFTITPTASGCPGPSITATVLVNPTPNAVAAPPSQTICSAGTITTIVLSGAVAGTTFNWTRDNTVTVTGIGASGSGNISGILTNTTFAPITVTFTITPTANGCPGPSITATVLVNPTPNAVATPPSQTVCSDNLIIPIILSGNVTGTTFNWTRNNTVTVLGTIGASGSGNISGTLSNTTNAPILVTFTITPIANGCPGAPITATVLTNPTPSSVATPASQTICTGATITTIVLTGPVAGTTFSWTRNNTAVVTGIAASGTGNISGSLTNITIAPVTVTFTITTIANGCIGTTNTATVVVNPTPTVTCPANIVVNAVAGTCSAVVNYPPATATGVPAPTITYSIPSGSSFPVGVNTVTATATNICGTSTCSFTITVNDVRLPTISTQPVGSAVCVGNSATFSVVATNVVSYQWQTGNANNQWGNIPGATSSTFTVNNAPLSMNNSLFRVALTGPCGTVVYSNVVTFVVNPLPLITLSASGDPVLLPNRSITITANPNPPGGSFVWLFNGSPMTGITGSSLGPLTVLNVGTYNVIYTDLNGCISTSLPFNITAGVTNYLWVYPNPNQGQFTVRFYNITGEKATLKIFNAIGQEVFTQSLVLGVAYSNFIIDLRRLSAGEYNVRIMNGSGAELATKRLMIYHP